MTEQGPMTEAMYYILLSLLKPGHEIGRASCRERVYVSV